MSIRTDLAIELAEQKEENIKFKKKEEKKGEIKITEIEVETEEQSRILGKEKGKYITLEFPIIDRIISFENLREEIKNKLLMLLPERIETILAVGLGNTEITSDSIGPLTADKILATRHISKDLAEKIGLSGLKKVAVATPNVLGKTGIESAEMIASVCKEIKPSCVVVIDALCSSSIERIFKTVQLSNTGISPGSGVKNSRRELSQKTLNVPVISVGIPTVIEASVLANELIGANTFSPTDLILTPKDADILVHRISELLASSLNLAFQPHISPEILFELT